MGGSNPYIESAPAHRPRQAYRLVFVHGEQETVVEVDPAALPYSHEGLPGSVLDVAAGHGIPLDHACGGVCACSTCHVYVERGAESCNDPGEAEEDMLDLAPALRDSSRLGCQCIPDGRAEVRVVIPRWNRNAVKEEH